jgi:hypothetical protein
MYIDIILIYFFVCIFDVYSIAGSAFISLQDDSGEATITGDILAGM